jgi:hypothetical protein
MTADLRAIGQPGDHTLVELTWREKRIEHRIRFGRIVDEQRLDRHRRIVSLRRAVSSPSSAGRPTNTAPSSRGSTSCDLSERRALSDAALRAAGRRDPVAHQRMAEVQRVLAAIDAIEALGIDPADVAPEHWRHLNHRIASTSRSASIATSSTAPGCCGARCRHDRAPHDAAVDARRQL